MKSQRPQYLEGLRAENERLRAQLEQLSRLAYRDPLTGLRNRRYLEERLAEELASARRRGQVGSLVLLDLDDFKRVNDELGHLAGDQLLRWLGGFLEEHLRAEDVACRLGGDEFVLVLPDTSEAGAHRAAARLREQLGLASRWHGGALGASVGVASWADGDADAEALLRRADAAMYQEKAVRKASAQGVPRAA